MKRAIVVLSIVAMGLALFPNSAFCGEKDGITDKNIKIGLITILTGPSADVGEGGKRGAILAVEEVNKAGGIHGRKIELVFDDSAYQPAKAVAAVKKQIHRDKVFAFVGPCGSHTALATIPLAEEGKVPMIENCGLTRKISDPCRKYVFHAMLTSDLDSHITWAYLMKNMKPAPKTVGILTYQGAYGKSKHADDLVNAERNGVKVVADEWCQWGDVDYTTQILKIKEAKPDVFMLTYSHNGQAKL